MRFFRRPRPTHCRECGRELVSDERHHDFDPLTGRARKVTRWLECPMYIGYGWAGSNGHYKGCITTSRALDEVKG